MIEIWELRGRQSMKSVRVLIQKLSVLETQLTAKEFTYREFEQQEPLLANLRKK